MEFESKLYSKYHPSLVGGASVDITFKDTAGNAIDADFVQVGYNESAENNSLQVIPSGVYQGSYNLSAATANAASGAPGFIVFGAIGKGAILSEPVGAISIVNFTSDTITHITITYGRAKRKNWKRSLWNPALAGT